MKKFVFLSLWILSTVSCEKSKEDILLGGVDGFTFIGSTNKPLKGLEVDLNGYNSKLTDVNGYFKFDNVTVGDYTVSVYQVSKFLSSKPVTVREGNISHVSFSFEYVVPPKKDLPDFTPIDLSNELTHTWDYQVAGKEEYFYFDVKNSLPISALYRKGNKDYAITFNAKGLPKRVTTDGFVFLFDHFNGNKVDLGILFPSGESLIFREVKTDFTWPTSPKSTQSKADVIRWTGRVIGAIPCVTTGVAAVVTGGAAIPLTLWTCGNYFLKMADNFFDDAGVENGFTKFFDDYKLASTSYSCATDIPSCLTGLAQSGLEKYADYIEEMEKREAEIAKIEVLIANNIAIKTVTIQPGSEGKDASIILRSFDDCKDLYEHSGNDSVIMVVYDCWGICQKEIHRMLIQFPLSQIPSNATVASATFEIYGSAITHSLTLPTLSLWKVKSSWNEVTTEWMNESYLEEIGKITFDKQSVNYWCSWDVVDIVRNWVSGKESNFGFEVSTFQNSVYAFIRSGDHLNTNTRPRLIVSYY